jgi:hypothetical protein
MTVIIDGTSGITTPGVVNSGNQTVSGSTTFTGPTSLGDTGIGMGAGFRNRFINGSFMVNQRTFNNTQTYVFNTTALLTYPIDRWFLYPTAGTLVGQRILGASTSSQYQYLITATTSLLFSFGQRIEAVNCFDLAGNRATLSFYSLLNNPSGTALFWQMAYATTTDSFGTAATPTKTVFASGYFNAGPSTLTQTVITVAVPAAATTGIEILISTVPGQAFATGQSVTFDRMQFEKGSAATPFDYRPYGKELDLCRRYYQQVGPYTGTVFTSFSSGFALSDTTATTMLALSPPTRVPPTLTYSALTDIGIRTITTVTSATSVLFVNSSTLGGQLNIGVAAGNGLGTTGAGCLIGVNNTGTFSISAEL